MTLTELQKRLAADPRPILLHVLPEEVFEARRLPGSLNACVYEMVFPDRVRELVADPATPLIVYGAGGDSLDAKTALEILRGAGYGAVEIFEGGLEAWEGAALPLEGSGEGIESTIPEDGAYSVDATDSVIRWTGRNLFNHHSGTVALAKGALEIKAGALVSASFEIAMGSIACEDIADTAMNRLLIQHLHTTDFFDVAHHPVATFVSTGCEAIEGATPGRPNFRLQGLFTLRGISRPLEFPIVAAAAGKRVTGQAQISLNRTTFGSRYGSGRFYRFLGKHVVNDLIELHLKIQADRSGD
jgi:polyisoprenoid-binding protein YceI/rhodanese-related sulfurtransferase